MIGIVIEHDIFVRERLNQPISFIAHRRSLRFSQQHLSRIPSNQTWTSVRVCR